MTGASAMHSAVYCSQYYVSVRPPVLSSYFVTDASYKHRSCNRLVDVQGIPYNSWSPASTRARRSFSLTPSPLSTSPLYRSYCQCKSVCVCVCVCHIPHQQANSLCAGRCAAAHTNHHPRRASYFNCRTQLLFYSVLTYTSTVYH